MTSPGIVKLLNDLKMLLLLCKKYVTSEMPDSQEKMSFNILDSCTTCTSSTLFAFAVGFIQANLRESSKRTNLVL